jgi:hypothetical protein
MGHHHTVTLERLEARLLEPESITEEQLLSFCHEAGFRTKRCADSWMVYEGVKPGEAAYASTLLGSLKLFLSNHQSLEP